MSKKNYIISNDDLYELLQVKRPREIKERDDKSNNHNKKSRLENSLESLDSLDPLESLDSLDSLDYKPYVDIQSMNPRIQRILLNWQVSFSSSISKKIQPTPIDQLFFHGSMLWIPETKDNIPFITFLKNKVQYRPKTLPSSSSSSSSFPEPKPYPLYAERLNGKEKILGIPASLARELYGTDIWDKAIKYECWNCMHADFQDPDMISKMKIGNGEDNTIPQQQCIDSVFKAWEKEQFPFAYLNAYCGAGKTVMALEIIRRNKRRCAFIVADTGIAKQTEQRIKTFLPDAQIGWIHGDRCEVIGKDIVIVSLKSLLSRGEYPPLHDYSPDEYLADLGRFEKQEAEFSAAKMAKKDKKTKCIKNTNTITTTTTTIAVSREAEKVMVAELFGDNDFGDNDFGDNEKEMDSFETDIDFDFERQEKVKSSFSYKYKKYPWQLLATCDLIVLDEAHGFVSQKHSTVYQYFCPRRVLTLTATPTREGRECVEVMWILGRTAAILERPLQLLQVKALRVETDIKNPPYDKHGNMLYSLAMTNLSKDKRRNQQIVTDLLFAVEQEKRTVLVLSYRKNQLVDLASEFIRRQRIRDPVKIGLYFPESKLKTGILDARVIFATYQRAAQALDVQELNTVFLCLPIKSHTKQVVGRILRSGGKAVMDSRTITPTVYDYVDPYCNSFYQLWMSRKRFYEENDYEIEFINSNLKEIPLDFSPEDKRKVILDMLDETEINGLLGEEEKEEREEKDEKEE